MESLVANAGDRDLTLPLSAEAKHLLGDAGQTKLPHVIKREMQDEITPRHQKTPGELGDRSLGGYFV
jgi:hypothetical protein